MIRTALHSVVDSADDVDRFLEYSADRSSSICRVDDVDRFLDDDVDRFLDDDVDRFLADDVVLVCRRSISS